MSDSVETETIETSVKKLLEKFRFILLGILCAAVVALIAVVVGIILHGKSVENGLEKVETISFVLTKDASSLSEDETKARLNDAIPQLEKLSSKSGIVGIRASMLLADLYFQKGDDESLAKACDSWIRVTTLNKNAYTAPLAFYNAAVSSELLKDVDSAINYYEKSISFKDFPLIDHALFSLARVYEENSKKESAVATYQKLCDLHPTSTWANLAKSRLISLK